MNEVELKKQPRIKNRYVRLANKLLNVFLVIIGLAWLAGWYFSPKPNELQTQAMQEFTTADKMFSGAIFSKTTIDE